jgi:hypothetical protein
MAYPEKGVHKHHHRRHPDFLKAARQAEGVPEDEAPPQHPGLQGMDDEAEGPPNESVGMGPAPEAPENQEG